MQDLFDKLPEPLSITGGILLLIGYVYLTVLMSRLLRRHPTTFSVAVLGFPHSGKTVFITTLFDQLQQGKSQKIHLTPYGSDTVEEVTSNLNSLGRGVWLPRTTPGNVFFFRAVASLREPFSSRIKLEIGDFAGEDIAELQPSSDRWLHKSDYFKYVIDADAIMLALDGESLKLSRRDGVDELVNAFVAAIQIIADYQGAAGDKRLKTPVAALVMKADVLDEQSRFLIEDRLQRLISVCKTRCRNFRLFFVSSTGPLDEDGSPPTTPQPEAVVEPLEWALTRATVLTLAGAIGSILRPSQRDKPKRWDTLR
jgi:hypothetical protein